MSVDTSELDDWAADIEAAAKAVDEQGKKILSRGAFNIKRDAAAAAPSGPLTPHYPKSITYDVRDGKGWMEAEIGPAKGRRQWGLGNLLEYGGHGTAPHPHLEPALDREGPKYIEQVEKLAADLLERYG